jgi:hypothetical protein
VGSMRYGIYTLCSLGVSAPFTLVCSYYTSTYILGTLFVTRIFGYKHIDMKTYFYLTLSVPCFDGVLFVICPFPCFFFRWRRAKVTRTRFNPGRASHGVAPMFHNVSPFRDPDHSSRAFQPIPIQQAALLNNCESRH